ncbi:MAG: hypothetical protein KF832_13765 [Caldilineaceae bacterium]|nr:hypothetical protein [Caldilineaceae bacterium]
MVQILTPANLGSEFDLGTLAAGKVHIKAGNGVALDATPQVVMALASHAVSLAANHTVTGNVTFGNITGLSMVLGEPGTYWLWYSLSGTIPNAANGVFAGRLLDNGAVVPGSGSLGVYMLGGHRPATQCFGMVLHTVTAPRTIQAQAMKGSANLSLAANTTQMGYLKIA